MKFRYHRRLLSESMETVIEISSKAELVNILQENIKWTGDTIEDVKQKHIGMDNRIEWDTFMILVKVEEEEKYLPVGWTDEVF